MKERSGTERPREARFASRRGQRRRRRRWKTKRRRERRVGAGREARREARRSGSREGTVRRSESRDDEEKWGQVKHHRAKARTQEAKQAERKSEWSRSIEARAKRAVRRSCKAKEAETDGYGKEAPRLARCCLRIEQRACPGTEIEWSRALERVGHPLHERLTLTPKSGCVARGSLKPARHPSAHARPLWSRARARGPWAARGAHVPRASAPDVSALRSVRSASRAWRHAAARSCS